MQQAFPGFWRDAEKPWKISKKFRFACANVIKTRSKRIVSNMFFVKIGGEEGIRSRLRARSGCVLTSHRGVIHSAPVRILSNANAKRTPFGVLRWRRGRDSLSPAGSVRVRYDTPPGCHSFRTRSNPFKCQRKKDTFRCPALAERKGFEPLCAFAQTDFESAPL